MKKKLLSIALSLCMLTAVFAAVGNVYTENNRVFAIDGWYPSGGYWYYYVNNAPVTNK